MGATLTWRPVKNDARVWGSGSKLASILRTAFRCPLPVELGEKEIPILIGILACGHEDVQGLIDAIQEHGRVVVEVEY